MSNLAVVNNQSSLTDATQWNQSQLELIKTQIARDCSDEELKLFGMVCQRTGLDPFARQIYALVRNDRNAPNGKKMSIQISIDGFRLAATRSGKYGGSQTFWCGVDQVWREVWLTNDLPLAAKTEVYRLGSDRPFVGVAKFDSYKQEYNGKLSNLWAKFPDLMIGKCSESLALRKAFPAELSGLYSTEEMGQADDVIDTTSNYLEPINRISKEQIEKLKEIGKSVNMPVENCTAIFKVYGYQRSSEIEIKDYNAIYQDIIDAAESWAASISSSEDLGGDF